MKEDRDRAGSADRVRALLAEEPSTREITMFGGRAFMVHDKMICCAFGTGALLVRIDPRRDVELIGRSGASRAEMGVGRTMGAGWIAVSAASIVADEHLAFWIAVAREYNADAAAGR